MTNNNRFVFNSGIKFFLAFNLVILSTILFTSINLFVFIFFLGSSNKFLRNTIISLPKLDFMITIDLTDPTVISNTKIQHV
jgi:hypothetical protein